MAKKSKAKPRLQDQYDKRVGITYVYETVSRWVPELKQSRSTRKLIGKRDPETGKIIPTDQRMKKAKRRKEQQANVADLLGIQGNAKHFAGATYMFDKIVETMGLQHNLMTVFPHQWDKILSIAYFIILNPDAGLYQFDQFDLTHKHPYGANISSQQSSELFANITEEQKNMFFHLQAANRVHGEYWAYDTTSISSYSKQLSQVKYGRNKDRTNLPQINLALVYGEQSQLPFYYRVLPGNVTDVTTLQTLLADFTDLDITKANLVMDRGFYSQTNITTLLDTDTGFVMAPRTDLKWFCRNVLKHRDTIMSFKHLNATTKRHQLTIPISLQTITRKKHDADITLYHHVYYSKETAADKDQAFTDTLTQLEQELNDGADVDKKPAYSRYFTITQTATGREIARNHEAIEKHAAFFGFTSLISNKITDPTKASQIYARKDVVEKAYSNIKDRLNMRTTMVSSEASLQGKIFVVFIGLIILSYIKNMMQQSDIYQHYTTPQILSLLDTIECYTNSQENYRYSEILTHQIKLYEALGITPPTP